MRMFLLEQSTNNDYDTYDSCVVVAESMEEVKKIHPNPYWEYKWDEELERFCVRKEVEVTDLTSWPFKKRTEMKTFLDDSYWAHHIDDVKATYLGRAKKGSKTGVICSSFNAG